METCDGKCLDCGYKCDNIEDVMQHIITHHKIKSFPNQFQAILDGDKKHEVRKFDRNYQQGHYVTIQEWEPNIEQYTGREIQVVISNITWPGTFGLPKDIGVFSFALI